VTESASSFREVGSDYGDQLARGLSLTGESADYYALRRITRVGEIARALGVAARGVLDFGCGTGTSLPLLREVFPEARIVGFEPAQELAEIAAKAAATVDAEVLVGDELSASRFADVVYSNGVFHHIPRGDRGRAASSLSRALRAGGLAFVWENSPFNPGTRLVMSRIPFDRDAVLLTPRELRSLQVAAGLTAVTTEFHFVFPRALRFARGLEHALRSLPLGGQYVVVGRLDPAHG
jgi:SAM-dependent methyltransferase